MLYWDFLIRHESRFARHPRAAMQWRMLQKLQKLQDEEKAGIVAQAASLRRRWESGS